MSSTIGALGVHDLGGTGSSEEKIPHFPDDKAFAHWERVTHVLLGILTRKQLLTLDEHRRAVEALPQYNELSYYERWASGTAALCVEKGLFTKAELDAELGEVPTDETIRFKSGDVVRVRDESSTVRWRKPHLRAPGYIHGLVGTIEGDCCGLYADPESLAFAEPARRQPLYRVRFHQQDLWEGYQGSDEDTVVAEVYQAWLLPATVADLVTQRRRSARLHKGLAQGTVEHRAHAQGEEEEGGQGPSKKQRKEGSSHSHSHGHGQPKEGEKAHDHDHEGEQGHAEAQGAGGKEDHHHHHHHHHHHEHAHEHEHEHEHEHGEEGHAHVHEGSLAVETKAVEVEGDDSARRRFPEAVARLLDKKGIATNEEVRKALEAMDSKGEQRGGARLVARAWTDPEFKARLLADGNAAAAELGLEGSNWPARTDLPADCKPKEKYGTVLTAVENTPEVHNLIVCTLCSCYPIAILGMSPSWYKSRAYRARAIRDPRGVLAEMGLKLPTDVSVKVHDSTADSRYLVLPERPAGTEGWSEEQLATLVTRDAMVGVARASEPQPQPQPTV